MTYREALSCARRRRWLGLCAGAALLALPLRCSLYGRECSVALELPELPGQWQACFGEVAWQVIVPGTGLGLELPAGYVEAPAIGLPKLQHQPVLAFPRCPGCGFALPPAAGVFPLDLSSDQSSLILSWEQGPAGGILLSLIRQRLEVETLNVPRLCQEILARFPTDPWCLDLDGAAAALAGGSFRVTDLRALPSREVVLEVNPGLWFLESPFFAPIPMPGVDSESRLLLPEVSYGLHRLFEVNTGWVGDLWVDERQVLWIPAAPVEAAARVGATNPARATGRNQASGRGSP